MLIDAFGVVAAASLVATYGLEGRSHRYVLGFAAACLAVALYGAITGAWLFAVLEVVWAAIATRRWRMRVREEQEERHD